MKTYISTFRPDLGVTLISWSNNSIARGAVLYDAEDADNIKALLEEAGYKNLKITETPKAAGLENTGPPRKT